MADFFWSRILSRKSQIILLAFFLLFCVCLLIPSQEVPFNAGLSAFVPIHQILEVFSIVVSVLIFVAAWESKNEERILNTMVVAIGFLAVAVIDFAHTLSFPGMPDFITPANSNKAIFFWLIGRGLVTVLLLFLVLSRPWKGLSKAGNYGLVFLFLALSLFVSWFGITEMSTTSIFFTEGVGLTPLKLVLEGSVVFGLILALIFLIKRSADLGKNYDVENVAVAIALMIMSEGFLMVYKSVSDIYNIAGHAYKAIAYIFFYRALFRQGIQKPYALLRDRNRELEEARAEANAAYLAKSQFLANISHEIRTPMNSILGMAELLEDTQLSSDQAHYVSVLKGAGEHLVKLVTDVLDLSRIEAGFLDLYPEEFDLHAAIGRMEQLLAVNASKKKLPLSFTVHRSVPRKVIGDPIKFNRILFNLVGNAIKFTDSGSIDVNFTSHSQNEKEVSLTVVVKDTGMGIPEEKMKLLFQSFVQLDPSPTRRHGGSGLGLVISKKLIEAMGGTISVKSHPGEGSEFTFTVHFQVPSPEGH